MTNKKIQKKVSIIVPVYNAEKYLKKLINSINEQTYKNFEVIFVNDGSKDDSLNVLKKLKKDNFIIIDQKNSGVSMARNKGLEEASGDYVTFVDSDDYIDKEYISCLVDNLEKNSADICVISYKKVYPNKVDILNIQDCNIITNNLTNQINFLNELGGSEICGKLYKKDLMHKFQKMSIGEDTLYNLQYIIKNNKVTIVNKPYYNYVYNEHSAINSCKKDLLKELNGILKNIEIQDIYVFYTYRIYQEYLLNIFLSNKKILKECIYSIKDLELIYKFLTQDITNITNNFNFSKRIYLKIVNKCLKNKKFELLYILEKFKLVIRYGKKINK